MSVAMFIPIAEVFSDKDFATSDFLDTREMCDLCDEQIDYGEPLVVAIEGLLNPEGSNVWHVYCPECGRQEVGQDYVAAAYLLNREWGPARLKVEVLKDTRPPQIWRPS